MRFVIVVLTGIQNEKFPLGQLDASLSHLDSTDNKIQGHSRNLNDVNASLDGKDSELEYIENQNRRNNVKIIGVPENKETEKSWEDTEMVVKQLALFRSTKFISSLATVSMQKKHIKLPPRPPNLKSRGHIFVTIYVKYFVG